MDSLVSGDNHKVLNPVLFYVYQGAWLRYKIQQCRCSIAPPAHTLQLLRDCWECLKWSCFC